jgi:hypothetical protein
MAGKALTSTQSNRTPKNRGTSYRQFGVPGPVFVRRSQWRRRVRYAACRRSRLQRDRPRVSGGIIPLIRNENEIWATAREELTTVRDRHVRYGAIGSMPEFRQYEEGRLLIDFVEVGSIEIIWSGNASDIIEESQAPEQARERVKSLII